MTTPTAPYAIVPLTVEDLCEGYILTWDGRNDPVTVVECHESMAIVETPTCDRIRLTNSPDGLMPPDEDTPLESMTIIGTRRWQEADELWEYLTDTYEFPTEFSAVSCAADLDMTVEEMNHRISDMLAEPRSSLLLVRETYDRWTAYQVGFGMPSTQDLVTVLESQTPVDNADAKDDTIVCTLPADTTAVPKALVDIAYDARWAIARFDPGDGEGPAECILTPQRGDPE
ncbi:hypothetical protein [Halobaculum magnesiiphilum]|uniref:Uncharacterized protein n=1 Tax=Halobaculum magnesiiphilum TaxID=1017351 RepID=A0A8T8WI13_9EURY|nr:hypothetical protein [Halobaculum magnesiiphilum]QZP39512.1 hypothetical protein K6T50_18215 [Halobaculum magnesiiphilum]